MIVTRPCDNCQTDYDADTRYLRRRQGLFCSQSCSTSYYWRTRVAVHNPNTECAVCKKGIYRKPSQISKSESGLFFCSPSHTREAIRMGIITTGPKSSQKFCDQCHQRMSPRTKSAICNCCKRETLVSQWLSGNNDVTLTKGNTRDTKSFVKRYLVATRGDRCENCGFDEHAPDGRSIIQLDHRDGNCLNNDPDNLRLLCPNCHAMTPNYGSLNRGSGRSHRRKH